MINRQIEHPLICTFLEECRQIVTPSCPQHIIEYSKKYGLINRDLIISGTGTALLNPDPDYYFKEVTALLKRMDFIKKFGGFADGNSYVFPCQNKGDTNYHLFNFFYYLGISCEPSEFAELEYHTRLKTFGQKVLNKIRNEEKEEPKKQKFNPQPIPDDQPPPEENQAKTFSKSFFISILRKYWKYIIPFVLYLIVIVISVMQGKRVEYYPPDSINIKNFGEFKITTPSPVIISP